MDLRDKIEAVEQENLKGLKKAQSLSLKEQQAIAGQRAYEDVKFEKFKEIIKGERYFRIEHFKKLGIKYHIAIHLSAKNVGKTTELYRLIKDTLDRGKKFIYGRVTVQELETEVDKFREDAMSPVILVKQGARFFFFDKKQVNAFMEDQEDLIPTYTALIKAGLEIVGKGMTFMGANILGSGNYADYEMIFFDEIVSYTPKQYVNDRIMYNWGVAISTILRNKEDLTVIMMGNLQNNITNVPILSYYGIDIGDNLRVIKRAMGNGDPCTILYVNSGSLYNNSLKNQASVAHHASLDDRLFMEHNKIINTNIKVLNASIVGKMRVLCSFAVEYQDGYYALELRGYSDSHDELSVDESPECDYYALCIQPLTITTVFKGEAYTHDPLVSNKFTNIIYRKNLRGLYKFVYKLFINNVLYYDSANSLELGGWFMEDIVRLYLDRTDPKRIRL